MPINAKPPTIEPISPLELNKIPNPVPPKVKLPTDAEHRGI